MKKFTITHLLPYTLGLVFFLIPASELQAQSKAPLNWDVFASLAEDIDAPVVVDANDTPDEAAEPVLIMQDRSMQPAAPLEAPVMATESVIVDNAAPEVVAPATAPVIKVQAPAGKDVIGDLTASK